MVAYHGDKWSCQLIDFEIQGLAALEAKFDAIPKKAAVEVRKAINKGAQQVKSEAVKLIRTNSPGRKYKRGKITHVASKKGDAPNTDTGNLIRNIRVSSGNALIGRGYFALVRAITPYASRLEYEMKRPFMGPALKAKEKSIRDELRKALRRSV